MAKHLFNKTEVFNSSIREMIEIAKREIPGFASIHLSDYQFPFVSYFDMANIDDDQLNLFDEILSSGNLNQFYQHDVLKAYMWCLLNDDIIPKGSYLLFN